MDVGLGCAVVGLNFNFSAKGLINFMSTKQKNKE